MEIEEEREINPHPHIFNLEIHPHTFKQELYDIINKYQLRYYLYYLINILINIYIKVKGNFYLVQYFIVVIDELKIETVYITLINDNYIIKVNLNDVIQKRYHYILIRNNEIRHKHNIGINLLNPKFQEDLPDIYFLNENLKLYKNKLVLLLIKIKFFPVEIKKKIYFNVIFDF